MTSVIRATEHREEGKSLQPGCYIGQTFIMTVSVCLGFLNRVASVLLRERMCGDQPDDMADEVLTIRTSLQSWLDQQFEAITAITATSTEERFTSGNWGRREAKTKTELDVEFWMTQRHRCDLKLLKQHILTARRETKHRPNLMLRRAAAQVRLTYICCFIRAASQSCLRFSS